MTALGAVSAQLETMLVAILAHADGHPEAHGGLLTEAGGRTVREVHAADLPWIERPWPWGAPR